MSVLAVAEFGWAFLADLTPQQSALRMGVLLIGALIFLPAAVFVALRAPRAASQETGSEK
jgi:hypothetical protein